jgi:hypothetical protein
MHASEGVALQVFSSDPCGDVKRVLHHRKYNN